MSLPTASKEAPPRLARLKQEIALKNIDVLVAFKPEVTFLLTGFTPIIYSNPVIVIMPLDHDPILLVYALRDEIAHTSPWVTDIRLYGTWSASGRVSMGETWDAALSAILTELGVSNKTVGVEANFIPVDFDRQLRNALPDATFADVSALINTCRSIKDEDEIADARIAAKIADVGIQAAVECLAAGGNEQDASIASMHAMNKFWVQNYPEINVCTFGSLEGGQHNGLEAWLLSGPRKYLNCAAPTARKPEIGDTVSVFVWAVANGMRAEVERTVRVGTVATVEREAIRAVYEIREGVAQLMKPGTRANALYEASRRGFEMRGYKDYVPGRIGHAIGLGNHEDFSINANSPWVLTPGMIITLEPHIQIPGICSTQFSDTILITAEGYEYLTSPPNDEKLEINPPIQE